MAEKKQKNPKDNIPENNEPKQEPKKKAPKSKQPKTKEPKGKQQKNNVKMKKAFILEGRFDRRLVFDVDGSIKLETPDGFFNIAPEKILTIVMRKRGAFRREVAISIMDSDKKDGMQVNGVNIWLLVSEKGNRKNIQAFTRLCEERGILVCSNKGHCDESYIESTLGGASSFMKITGDSKVVYCYFGVPTYLDPENVEIHLRKDCIWWYAGGENKSNGFTSVEPKKRFRAKLPKFAENLKKCGFKVL